jgi:hypothetical protein
MSNAFLASNGVPAWLDAWLFGWAQVGPLVSTTQLVQATRQEVQVSSGGGAFTVYFPSNMQVNDTIKFVDIGNQIPGNNVSLSPSALGYQIQNPYTLALQTGAYAWGSNEVAGSTITFQLVQDPTLGYYLKYLPGAGIAQQAGLVLINHTPYVLDSGADTVLAVQTSLAGSFTITLPALPAAGRTITILDNDGVDPTITTYAVTVNGNGQSFSFPGYRAGAPGPLTPTLIQDSASAVITGHYGAYWSVTLMYTGGVWTPISSAAFYPPSAVI